jgi:hypothetical protein
VQLYETVSAQQAFLSSLSTKLELYNREKSQMRQRVGELTKESEDARRENAKLLETLTKEMEHSKSLQGDVDKSAAHVRALEGSLMEEKRLRMAVEKELNSSRAQTDALQSQLSGMEYEVRQCIDKLGQMSSLKAQMSGLNGFLEDLQEQNVMLREELDLERQKARTKAASPINQRQLSPTFGPILARDPIKPFFQSSPEKTQNPPFPGMMESSPTKKSFATQPSVHTTSKTQPNTSEPTWPMKIKNTGGFSQKKSPLKLRNGLTTEPPIWTMRGGPSSPVKKEQRSQVALEQQAMGSQNTQMFSWLEMGNPNEEHTEEAPTFLFEEAEKAKLTVAEFTEYIQNLEDS